MTEIDAAVRTLWRFHCVPDVVVASDVIVGLGSYDIRVALRCADLFHAGMSPRVIFTGATGNWTRGLYPAGEARAFAARAIEAGVPEDALTLETRATNLGENIRFSAALAPEARRAIIVTKPQTQRRCRATAKKQWPGARCLVTAPETEVDEQPLPHHDRRALICEMVGDLDRMGRYAELGFQAEVVVPDKVREAFDVLVAAGYVDHLQGRPTDR